MTAHWSPGKQWGCTRHLLHGRRAHYRRSKLAFIETRHSYASEAVRAEAAGPADSRGTQDGRPAAAAPAMSRRALGAAAIGLAATSNSLGSAGAAADSPAAPPPAKGASLPAGTLREYRMVMRATALRGSVPQEWLSDFRTSMDGFGLVALTQQPRLADIYRDLKGLNKKGKAVKPTTMDVVTLGDAWLERAIVERLIQPISDAREYRWWSLLGARWRQLVCRDARGQPLPQGEVWAAPYRWGCTLVAYKRDKLLRWGGTPINDWEDLLQPGLKGQIGFVDSPREFVGVALRTLGLPFNASLEDMRRRGVSTADLRSRVLQLKRQVRVFSNTDHVRAFNSGDVSAVVGWSEDLLGLRATNLVLAAPVSGTALWADLWAEDGEPSPLLPAWLELPLQPVRAHRSRGLRGGASPLLLPPPPLSGRRQGQPGAEGRGQPPNSSEGSSGSSALEGGVMPSEGVLQRSEFLLPLDIATIEAYNDALRRGP